MASGILKINQDEGGLQLVAEGDFTVRNSASIKTALLESISRQGNETLVLKDVTALDLAGIQLAYAWRKVLQAQGRDASIVLPEDEGIKDLVRKTGITTILK
jgi:anti-anti-sigma regulatory factor